ncbi:zinc finger BED domain-containing 1-like protein [Labeo rohita]|uniref:Zinc finger BED domain-containing 1-like protein n=1 Tax=Labeo rohita TaxID=84645 RepID=A0A498LX12_LABRO|nr:zinc finger BED domain-containing 1-like protein [Labeo rohita]
MASKLSASKQAKLPDVMLAATSKRVPQATVDKLVISFICESLQPSAVVEQPSFKELITTLQLQDKVISRSTVHGRISDAADDLKKTIITELAKGQDAIRSVCDEIKVKMLNPAEVGFLREYCITMKPLLKASNIFQSESSVYLGWLLPVIHQAQSKLNRLETSSRTCTPLIRALQNGLQRCFGQMMEDPELGDAAVLLPKFKTSWTDKPDVIEAELKQRIEIQRVSHRSAVLQKRRIEIRKVNLRYHSLRLTHKDRDVNQRC